ncbi:MAG: hypothetical protein EA424_00685 [Planctomycetaceae bacterium]|nr:MAG: hypothetical protein EA424_00685 [Planctomycetaceae bacterium]
MSRSPAVAQALAEALLAPRPDQPSPAVIVAGQFTVIEPAAVLVAARRIGCDLLVSSGPDPFRFRSTMASITGRQRRGPGESA